MKNRLKQLLAALVLCGSMTTLSAKKAYIKWDLSPQSVQMMELLGVIGRQAESEKMALVTAALELGRDLLAHKKAHQESGDDAAFLASIGTDENKDRMMTLSTLASMVGPFVADAFKLSNQIDLAVYTDRKPLLQRLGEYADEKALEKDLFAALATVKTALQFTEQVAALVDAIINNTSRALRAGLTVYYARQAGKTGTKMQLAKDADAKQKVDALFAPLQ